MKRVYQFGPCRLDPQERTLQRDCELVPLTPKVFDTLVFLVENAGRLIEKNELLEALWPGTFVEEGNLTFNISVLRKALGEWENGDHYIKTIPKKGYRFVATVNPVVTREAVAASGSSVEAGAPSTPPPVTASHAELGGYRPWLTTWGRATLGTAAVLVLLALGYFFLTRPLPRPAVRETRALTNDGQEKGGLVTDGLRLYFTESSSEGTVLKSISIASGEMATILSPFHDFDLLDISQDRSFLLLGSSDLERPFWLMPLPGGSPRRLGDILGHGASFSPDGRQLVYANGNDLYVANSEGGDPHRVFTVRGDPRWVRESPDGNRLRFTIWDAANLSDLLWEVSMKGEGLRRLLTGWKDRPNEEGGEWTTDGRYFLFGVDRGGHADIWVTREAGNGLHRRSHDPVRLTQQSQDWAYPVAGLDGKTVFAVGGRLRGELDRYDSRLKLFVPYLNGISAQWASFSPDGNRIAYVLYPQGTLWRMNRDGSQATQLTFAPMNAEGGLSWSPDGTQIAVRARTPAKPFKIYLVATGDGYPKELLPDRPEEEGIPTWSPDGKQIAFGDVPAVFRHPAGNEVIHLYDLATRQLSKVPHSEGLWTARWSPDGRYIAALSIISGQLMLFDCHTKSWRGLSARLINHNIFWSRHGNYIYCDGQGGHEGISRVRISDGRLETVANLNGIQRVISGWSGLAPDDSPLILRDIGSEEIYALDVDWP